MPTESALAKRIRERIEQKREEAKRIDAEIVQCNNDIDEITESIDRLAARRMDIVRFIAEYEEDLHASEPVRTTKTKKAKADG